MVQKLAKGPKCVSDIEELLDVPQANVSQHLTVLRSHQIVDFYEEGKLRCYFLSRPQIATLVDDLLSSEFPVVEYSAAEIRAAGAKRSEELHTREHWEDVYSSKSADEVGWFKPTFDVSRRLVKEVAPEPTSRIIDVGGGASRFVDGLLADGSRHITVLDIASAGLEQAKHRLGAQASLVNWIVGDICRASPLGPFDVWHDRAVFHFLTDPDDRQRYAAVAKNSIPIGGHAIIATFSATGPQRCSGLPTCRYTATELATELGSGFALVTEIPELHTTPRGKPQSFIYTLLRRTDS
jgi:DNA-binding transcriptional ArsR family regulator